MKKIYASLLVMLTTVFFTQQSIAQGNYEKDYDLSDYLDLQAVASVFSYSRNLNDFENNLNDYRNPVSNLDLNNDGYVDYLRLIKVSDSYNQVILIQAVLGNNYFQDVATIVVGRDNWGRDYVQIIGEPYLYGNDYILEPVFSRRPPIVRWLRNNSRVRYVSVYHWNYYPSYYRMRRIMAIHSYYSHLNVFIDVRHKYYYTDYRRHNLDFNDFRTYRRNDYWRDHSDRRFDRRHTDVKNKRDFRPDRHKLILPREKQGGTDVRPNENNRREENNRVNPTLNQNNSQQRENRVDRPTPQRNTPNRESQATPSRETRPAANRQEVNTPTRENRPTVNRPEVKTAPAREAKPAERPRVEPKRESKPAVERKATPKAETKKESPKREATKRETKAPAREQSGRR